MMTMINRLASSFAFVLLAASGVAAVPAEVFPAADWMSHPSATIVAPADLEYPGTVTVSRNGPEPMVVTIAGTAEKPLPNGTGGITMGLSYVEGGYCWGDRAVLDFSKGGRQEAKVTVLSAHQLYSVFAYYSA